VRSPGRRGAAAQTCLCIHGGRHAWLPWHFWQLQNQPIIYKRRPRSSLDMQGLNERCSALKEAGIIVPAPPSQYASEVTMPAKKDNEGSVTDKRFHTGVDFRPLNQASQIIMACTLRRNFFVSCLDPSTSQRLICEAEATCPRSESTTCTTLYL